MIWHDDAHYCRSFADGGYLMTWIHNAHGPYYKGWAPRLAGQRRGKQLAASYSRTDVERACRVHFQNKSRETVAEVRA